MEKKSIQEKITWCVVSLTYTPKKTWAGLLWQKTNQWLPREWSRLERGGRIRKDHQETLKCDSVMGWTMSSHNPHAEVLASSAVAWPCLEMWQAERKPRWGGVTGVSLNPVWPCLYQRRLELRHAYREHGVMTKSGGREAVCKPQKNPVLTASWCWTPGLWNCGKR